MSSEKLGFEFFVSLARLVHQRLEFGFIPWVLQEWVAHKVGITKKSALDAMPQHMQSGVLVAQHRVGLSDLVNALGIRDPMLFDPGFGFMKQLQAARIFALDRVTERLSDIRGQQRRRHLESPIKILDRLRIVAQIALESQQAPPRRVASNLSTCFTLERTQMANVNTRRGVIGILTGGGDVPGLNPAIRAVTFRAIREGCQVIGLRRGWAGLVDIVREKDYDNSDNFQTLTEEIVNRAGRTGGTFLHSSRTNPGKVKKSAVPHHLQSTYNADVNDLTPEVLKNLAWLGIDYLIPIGGDDTLSYGVRLYQEGVKVVAIPKTMDNDVPGTDYCVGFSTAVTRTIQMTNDLRTSAGSHERFLVLEVFGRYAGFTAMLPTMAGAANRCVIPEHRFDIEQLTELLVADRRKNPSRYSVVLVSEGAMFEGGDMVFEDHTTDAFGHKKLGGIGDLVSEKLKELSPKFNNGKVVEVINQKLGYLVRCGDPDAIDSIVPMAYGNLALDLLLNKIHGRLVVLKNGRYDNMPVDAVIASKKIVNVKEHYNTTRLRPHFSSFEMKPLFIMTSES
jgi:ATP-dependent phosphofructokinase / diphosphate-dependent phosphofructokinase